ncbi:Transcriptional activator feaR [Raoultella planticola]|uniref:Transcriptional activator feaR n=1 Tax=Raoultella planticola TaxID=575 RepID=A0A485D6F1_RAOPL|nr:Transcriptional activator feaR [Raoultella planticola]
MATAEHGQDYQRWLAKINQVCGHFAARPLEGRFHGEIDASYAGTLKVSTVTASGVNLFRTRNEIKRSNDDWFLYRFPALRPGGYRAGRSPGGPPTPATSPD